MVLNFALQVNSLKSPSFIWALTGNTNIILMLSAVAEDFCLNPAIRFYDIQFSGFQTRCRLGNFFQCVVSSSVFSDFFNLFFFSSSLCKRQFVSVKPVCCRMETKRIRKREKIKRKNRQLATKLARHTEKLVRNLQLFQLHSGFLRNSFEEV